MVEETTILSAILIVLIVICAVVVYQFAELQYIKMRLIETVGTLTGTGTGTGTGTTPSVPMSNTAYWDCIGKPTTTWTECQAFR